MFLVPQISVQWCVVFQFPVSPSFLYNLPFSFSHFLLLSLVCYGQFPCSLLSSDSTLHQIQIFSVLQFPYTSPYSLCNFLFHSLLSHSLFVPLFPCSIVSNVVSFLFSVLSDVSQIPCFLPFSVSTFLFPILVSIVCVFPCFLVLQALHFPSFHYSLVSNISSFQCPLDSKISYFPLVSKITDTRGFNQVKKKKLNKNNNFKCISKVFGSPQASVKSSLLLGI